MLRLATYLLLAAVAVMPSPPGPRLELTRVDPSKSTQLAGAAQHIADVRLTLINDVAQPVEARAHMGVVPRLFGLDGKPVVLMDFRNLAGYAPPELPPPPEAPVRRGERRQLESYSVIRLEQGYQFNGPYGGANLAPGGYRVEAGADFGPTTREAWVAQHAAAVIRPGRRPKDPQAFAEREAERFAAYFREAVSFFSGHLEAPPLELVLP